MWGDGDGVSNGVDENGVWGCEVRGIERRGDERSKMNGVLGKRGGGVYVGVW